jgi:hypothetical protein
MKASLLGVGLLALTATLGFAQAAPAPVQRHAATINQRIAHQQHRIAKGVRTGQIKPRQAGRLERREASIVRQEHHMRAAGHGRLNKPARVKLNRRLNRTSRAIYRAKHNRATKQALMKQ